MIAPTTLVRTDGLRVCLDAYDVCKIDECPDGCLKILHMATETPEILEVYGNFDEVLDQFAKARKTAMSPNRPAPGDEWRGDSLDDDY